MLHSALREIFDQGVAALEGLSDEDYTTPFKDVYNSTIGEHYRHLLEHFITLHNHLSEKTINYDQRERELSIQESRTAAIKVTYAQKEIWAAVSEEEFASEATFCGQICAKASESLSTSTSVSREVAYAIAHAHHHFAIIGIMCSMLKHETSSDFGIAPSTVVHKQNMAV